MNRKEIKKLKKAVKNNKVLWAAKGSSVAYRVTKIGKLHDEDLEGHPLGAMLVGGYVKLSVCKFKDFVIAKPIS